MTSIDPDPTMNGSTDSTFGKVGKVIDAVIVGFIALGQLLLSCFGMLVVFFLGGSAHPFLLIPYVFLGAVSAGILFSCRLVPRVIALVWQAILVTAALSTANASPADRLQRDRVLWVTPAILYLLLSAIIQRRSQENIKRS